MKHSARAGVTSLTLCHIRAPFHAVFLTALSCATGAGCGEGQSASAAGDTGGTGGSTSATGGTGGTGGDTSATGTGGTGGSTSATGGTGGNTSATGGTGGTGGSAANPCEEAGNVIKQKYMECMIPVMDPGGGDPPECTPELAAKNTCAAACTQEASCEALKGEDPQGAMEYSQCLGGC